MIIDFDSNDWLVGLDEQLGDLVADSVRDHMRATNIADDTDAREALLSAVDNDAVVDVMLDWIRRSQVRAYHGTRLDDQQVADVSISGLRPLDTSCRVKWLRRAFPAIGSAISEEDALRVVRREMMDIGRNGQVHAAISRRAMTADYDYATKGSEFDRRLVEHAGRPDLVQLLVGHGKARVITLDLPGEEALSAMHPYFSIEDLRRRGDLPNLVQDLFREYAWWLYSPSSERGVLDSCFLFKNAVPPAWIRRIDTI